MKNATILLAAFVIIPIISCKKKKPLNPTVQITNPRIYMQGNTGSYWVYQGYKVDSNNNETATPYTDSVYISDIKTMKGKSYVHYEGGIGFSGYYTDSGTFWINESGERFFSTLESAVDIYSKTYEPQSWYESYSRIVKQPAGFSSLSTQASAFSAKITSDLQSIKLSGQNVTQTITLNKAYVKNIGLVMYEMDYLSGVAIKEINRYKLLRYHIVK